jgi:hypothetical protein
MTNDPTKISFIPKNSLVGTDPFLARRRPRSILGILAATFFFLNIIVYVGIYLYKIQLSDQIKEKTTAIAMTNKTFKDSQIAARAKVFQARTQIGREVLDSHIVLSPIFAFVGESTLQSIHFESFDFTYDPQGSRVVLKGEVPGYASLAFQSDILQKRNQELLGFVVRDIKLSPSGSVSFSLEEIIAPSFISYAHNLKSVASDFSAIPKESVPASSEGSTEALKGSPTTGITDSTTTQKVAVPVQQTSSWSKKFFDLFK